MVVVVFAATALVFGLSRVNGDPRLVLLDEYTSKEQWDAWGVKLGLDKPLIVQYGIWVGNAARGDFGQSLGHRTNSLDVIIYPHPRHPSAHRLARSSLRSSSACHWASSRQCAAARLLTILAAHLRSSARRCRLSGSGSC